MALTSDLLRGNARLQQAAVRPPSIKPRPVVEDADAVARIQLALIALGHFPPDATARVLAGDGAGIYGPATTLAVKSFQRAAFPARPREWDGKCGQHTLTHLDSRLLASGAVPPAPSAPSPVLKPSQPAIPSTELSITPTMVDDQPMDFGYSVVDPMSVAQRDPRARNLVDLRYTVASAQLQRVMLDVRHEGRKYWVGAVVPAGLADFSSAHIFFHPSPGQAGLSDAAYDSFDGKWRSVTRYVPWLGAQLGAAKRPHVLLVPFMTGTYFSTLGLLATDQVARIAQLLSAVRRATAPQRDAGPGLTSLAASSFSVGVTCLAKFSHAVAGSGMLREVYDFDGLYSNSDRKGLAGIPGARFRKYSQNALPHHEGLPGFYVAPQTRWRRRSPPPRTSDETHGMMPDLFYHAASTTTI